MTDEAVFVALGSNMGDRRSNLDRALEALDHLEGTRLEEASSFIWTPPWGLRDQPWFLNAAARLATALEPSRLMELMLEIENATGRIRTVRNGPRTLDLDLLLFGDRIVETERLVLPHPRMGERHFVLAPLAQIAPDVVHPLLGKTISTLLTDLGPPPVGPPVQEVALEGP